MNTKFIIKNNVLMTSNNGYDKDTIPYIPVYDFVIDIWNGIALTNPSRCNELFNDLVSDWLLKEIRFLPKHMKNMAMKDIERVIADIEKAKKQQHKK